MIKIYINYDIKNKPWGGGNQFLKALRKQIIKKGFYTDSLKDANSILFNSHHKLE